MRTRSLLSFVGIGLIATGCSWYAPQAALNPKYKTADSTPGPARVMPILECRHTQDHGKPNPRQRELFLAAWPTQLWKAAGLSGEPVLSSTGYENPLCEEFYRQDNQRQKGYVMNARLQHAVGELLDGRSEQSLLVTTYFFPYRCDERKGTVADEQGRQLGTVGTGQVDCFEAGGVQVTTALLTRTDIVWSMSTYEGAQYNTAYTGTYDKAPELAAQLFGTGFPHGVIAAGTTVEQPAQPTASPTVTPVKNTPPTQLQKGKKKPVARQARSRALQTRS
ncbi:MAG TPA: hypothetical protein VGM90_24760 [Kofleriaceae bacterium]|jgi:hypothetical protein